MGALIFIAAFLWTVTATRGEKYEHVWPAPPDQGRIAFVQDICSPADLGIKPSGWSRFGAWITGQDKLPGRFVRPCGVAVDALGNLGVTDMGSSSVWWFDRRRREAHTWKRVGPIAFNSPVGIAKSDDRIFVADSGLGAIIAFNLTGQLSFVTSNSLIRPTAIAARDGRLYVTDSQRHDVAVFDNNGKFLFTFGKRGVGPGELNFPTHLSFGSDGEVLVTDSMNSRIEVFMSSGHFLKVIGGAGDGFGTFRRPKGVAADLEGRIYVADALLDNFQIFDSSGQLLLVVGSSGRNPGQFWMPAGMAIDPAQEIFVADSYNGRVQVFKYIGP